MATKCPDCGTYFRGQKCSCGYDPKQGYSKTPRASCHCGSEAICTIDKNPVCRRCYNKHWADEANGASAGIDWKTVKNKLSFAQPGRKWAEDIIKDYAEGHYGNEYGYRLACEAMKQVAEVKELEEF